MLCSRCIACVSHVLSLVAKFCCSSCLATQHRHCWQCLAGFMAPSSCQMHVSGRQMMWFVSRQALLCGSSKPPTAPLVWCHASCVVPLISALRLSCIPPACDPDDTHACTCVRQHPVRVSQCPEGLQCCQCLGLEAGCGRVSCMAYAHACGVPTGAVQC